MNQAKGLTSALVLLPLPSNSTAIGDTYNLNPVRPLRASQKRSLSHGAPMQQTRATNATACLQRKWSDYFFQIVKEQTAPGFKKPEPSKHPIRLVLASLRWPIRRMQDEHPPFILHPSSLAPSSLHLVEVNGI